jgi:hypothetical protein
LARAPFDLLVALIEHRDRVVSKDELLALVWPGLIVEENNLQVQVSTLRKILGYQAIATLPGKGYRFTLSPDGDGAAGAAAPAPKHNLPAGLNSFIGRDAETVQLRELLGRARLVTLTGAGGNGQVAPVGAPRGPRCWRSFRTGHGGSSSPRRTTTASWASPSPRRSGCRSRSSPGGSPAAGCS